MGLSFTFPQKVLFKHCDPAGIVFYPRYFEMMNDCIEAYFAEIGHPFEDMHKTAGVPTAQIEAAFKAPSRHGDHLDITLQLDHVGGSSVGIQLAAHSAAQLRFTAKSTLVYVDADGRPQKWTASLRTALAPYLSE